MGEDVLSDEDQVFSNLSRRLEIRSRPLIHQQEKYKGRLEGQLENTHNESKRSNSSDGAVLGRRSDLSDLEKQ